MRSYLQLARPANIVTAWADVLAGFAVTGGMAAVHVQAETLGWLLLATTGLYGGGVAFNDVFDADLDATERPERPIPSGRISRKRAALFAGSLFVLGISAAFAASLTAGLLAIAIAGGALTYNTFAKHDLIQGPITMGLCRGGNLLLGMAPAPVLIATYWPLALLPMAYIAAITAISQGEVHGGSSKTGYFAVGLVLVVVAVLGYIATGVLSSAPMSAVFPFVFVSIVLPPFLKAARQPDANSIRQAVRFGILGLIVLNATLAALYAGPVAGVVVLLLLPLSLLLARLFAVT
jgi:4-hydroxybenzoate polyprenyltransferase